MLTATNRHQRVAGVFLAATSLTVAVTWAMAFRFGLFGAAWSLLLSELLMSVYVLPATLRLAQDNLPSFLRSLLDLPAPLRPATLIRRVRLRLGW